MSRNLILPVVLAAVGLAGVALWMLQKPAEAPDCRITVLAASPSGRWMALGTGSGDVFLRDLHAAANQRQVVKGAATLNDLRFSPDEQLLAVAGRNLALYTLSGESRVLRDDDRNYGTARFHPDGASLLTVTGDAKIERIEIASGKLLWSRCCSSIAGAVEFSPDGTRIASAAHWPSLWDAASGQLTRRLTRDREDRTFIPIAFDEARQAVAMGSQDGRVYEWEIGTESMTSTPEPNSNYVGTVVALGGEAGWIAYAGFGEPLRIWRPESGEIRTIAAAVPASNIVPALSGTVMFGTAAGTVETWDVMKGVLVDSQSLDYCVTAKQ